MKLWLVERRSHNDCLVAHQRGIDPWSNFEGRAIKMVDQVVVRAIDEERARQLAQSIAMDERILVNRVWMDPEYSVCTEIPREGDAEVVAIVTQTPPKSIR